LVLTNDTVSGNTTGGGGFGGAGGGGGSGGGICSSNITMLTNSIVSGNTTGSGGGSFVSPNNPGGPGGYGGGLYSDGTLILYHSVVSGNCIGSSGHNSHWDGSGAGIYSSGPLTIGHSTVISNSTSSDHYSHGGGVYQSYSVAVLINSVIADNHAYSSGSGLYITSSQAQLLHTTIARNSGGDGSGIYGSGNIAMTNTILVSHTVGITAEAGSTTKVNGVLWYSNTANIGGAGVSTITHEIMGDPAFAADGYHLTSRSAAIDKGVDAGVTSDIDGDPRPMGQPDMGADEWSTRFYLPLVCKSDF
jgi:hypothetical protein